VFCEYYESFGTLELTKIPLQALDDHYTVVMTKYKRPSMVTPGQEECFLRILTVYSHRPLLLRDYIYTCMLKHI